MVKSHTKKAQPVAAEDSDPQTPQKAQAKKTKKS
jgi:hypothetical protein